MDRPLLEQGQHLWVVAPTLCENDQSLDASKAGFVGDIFTKH